jgi:mannose/fructose/N-acetylgalactosamine-specific phosphotransferase system component IID
VDKVQRNFIIGCIMCSLIILAGVVISLLPTINKLSESEKDAANRDTEFHTTQPSQPQSLFKQSIHSQAIDSFVIHIDDDTWIPVFTKEYRDQKKKEMMKKHSGDVSN